MVVTVSLSHASARAISIGYATQDGTAKVPCDYTPTAGMLTFAPGETSKSITIPLLTDGQFEGPETLTLVLSPDAASSASATRAPSTSAQGAALPSGSVAPAPVASPATAGASPPLTIAGRAAGSGTSVVTITILDLDSPPSVVVPSARNDPNNDDERGGNNEARCATRTRPTTTDDRRRGRIVGTATTSTSRATSSKSTWTQIPRPS